MSGLAQFIAARGLGTLQEWCEEGYQAVSRIDEELSGKGAEMAGNTTGICPISNSIFCTCSVVHTAVDYSQR